MSDIIKRFESRLSLGIKDDKTAIVGSLDRVSIKPIPLKPAVRANETKTSLKYDPVKKAIAYRGEDSSVTDYVLSDDIIGGANISALSGVGALTPGAIGIVTQNNNINTLSFVTPSPIEVNELSSGFVTYVTNPNDSKTYLRLIQPNLGGSADSILIGHPNGDMEFSAPIDSPLIVDPATLKSDGNFSGTPSTASGTWRYQQMGTTQVVSNTSGSRVEVAFNFRYSLQTAGTHSGVYASLINGGADYQTEFIDGSTSTKQEGYPGGYAEFKCVLDPNQKCQFIFGAWTNVSGNMQVTIGSIDESGGVTIYTVNPPTISMRRLI